MGAAELSRIMVRMAGNNAVVMTIVFFAAVWGGGGFASAQQRSSIGRASPPDYGEVAAPVAANPSGFDRSAAGAAVNPPRFDDDESAAPVAANSVPRRLTPEEAKRQYEENQRKLRQIEQERAGLRRDVRILAIERAQARQRLIEGARKVRLAERKLTEIEARLEKLRADEVVIRDSLEKRYASLAQILAVMQRLGRHPPPVIVTRRQDALKMVRSAMMLASFFPELKTQADRLVGELESLRATMRDSEKEKEKFKKGQVNLDELREEISVLMIKRRQQLAADRTRLDMLKVAAQRHTQAVNDLGDLLRKLDRDAKDAALNQVDMAAYEAELKSGRIVELKPEAKKVAFVQPGRMKPAVPFAEAKGMLQLPANGTRLKSYGVSDGGGGKSDGVSMETRQMAQITAPCDGWVLYAGKFRSYGHVLIINAGGGYHVLLAGMEQTSVAVGQFVLAGEPVASMGASRPKEDGGEAARPVLYIEFRKDQRPIDPDPWWSNGVEKG
jgi:septal ring factor EnvC (AmiA/AmiB activator)